jgi:hypothetical protein|tara:strand:- start:1563 stop:2354 length:792 start_codon:yes stop_codon:yes gene_type:complete
MEYGTAFHKALQEYYTNGNEKAAVAAAIEHFEQDDIHVPDNDFRDMGHLVATLQQYFLNYEKFDGLKADTSDNGPLLEQRFAVPYVSDGKLIDVVLCGTIDMIGTYNGLPALIDHKTTSLNQVEKYLDSYQNSPQMMFYSMIWKKLFPDEVRNVVINGIFLNRSGRNKFQRSSFITFSDHVLEEFEKHLRQTIDNYIVNLRAVLDDGKDPDDIFFPNFTCCETKFGACAFSPVCTTPRKEDRETIIDSLFTTTNTYDPLLFQA